MGNTTPRSLPPMAPMVPEAAPFTLPTWPPAVGAYAPGDPATQFGVATRSPLELNPSGYTWCVPYLPHS